VLVGRCRDDRNTGRALLVTRNPPALTASAHPPPSHTQAPEVSLILATGGPAMVRSAYSSGHPSVGVGESAGGSGSSGGGVGRVRRLAAEWLAICVW
jgi:hypothetical protein